MKNYSIDDNAGLEAAKKWLLDFIDLIKDGAVWAIPRSASAYRIDHTNKLATRLHGLGDSSTERVFKAIGWEVKV